MIGSRERLPAIWRARNHGIGARGPNSLNQKLHELLADHGEITGKKDIPFRRRREQARADGSQGTLIRPFIGNYGKAEISVPLRRGKKCDLRYAWAENLCRSQNQRLPFELH
jgi:hypothetical protein